MHIENTSVQVVAQLFDVLQSNDYRYVLMHEYKDFSGGDVDLCVFCDSEKSIGELEVLMQQNGWSKPLKLKFNDRHKQFYKLDKSSDSVVKIDLFINYHVVVKKDLYAISNSFIDPSPHLNGEVSIDSPENRAKYYILKLLLEKEKVEERHESYFKHLLSKRDGEDEALDGLISLYDENADKELVLNYCLEKGIVEQRHVSFLANFVYSVSSKLKSLKRRLCFKSNLFICFVGLDGSGKSTLIQCAREDLEERFLYSPSTVYLGHKQFVLPIFEYLQEKKKMRFFWFAIYMFLWPWELRLRLMKELNTTNVILGDRHPCFEPLIRKNKSMLLYWIYSAYMRLLVPSPDLLLYATGDVQTLYDRKKEMPFDVYADKHKDLEGLYEEYPHRKAKLLTDKELVDSVKSLQDAIGGHAVIRKLYES